MLVSSKREVKRWNVGDNEVLRHETIDEAMEYYLDDLADPKESAADFRAHLVDLGDIEVTGYAQMATPSPRAIGEAALEDIDNEMLCELMDPDGGSPMWSHETLAAARALGKAVLKDFWVWAMEPITSEKVNALAWVEENATYWLKK